jgi:two-component system, chemotaxis family, protein-glutamate methylesterase/glutaminase
MNPGQKIKVLIVDDSSVVRQMLTHILNGAPDIEVVGTAPDPYVARELLVKLKPDVMTLDIEMPRMDGISFLEKVMTHMPIPTVILSSLSKKGSELALRASAAGAVDVLTKPAIDLKEGLGHISAHIVQTVRAASKANLLAIGARRKSSPADIQVAKKSHLVGSLSQTTHQLLAIASSTGGTEALRRLLPSMPAHIPPTLIVQHMPPVFTKTFAANLNSICPFEVKEAEHGDRLYPGRVLLAPGDFHMTLQRSGAVYIVNLNQEAPQHNVRPAADPLFESVAKWAGSNAVGVVLTGMGKDGAKGLLSMKKAGSTNFAQDERSSVVFGMPKEAIDAGAVDHVLPLSKIAQALIEEFQIRDAKVELAS